MDTKAVFKSGASSSEAKPPSRRRFTPEEIKERRRAQDRARHWRNREKRLGAQRARYRADNSAWKNPDGTWKVWKNVERRRDVARMSYHKNKQARLERQKEARRQRHVHGQCPVCLDDAVRLFWDHDHATGEFRAYICSGCNLMLGHGRDNPALLRAAAEYLEAHTRRKAG